MLFDLRSRGRRRTVQAVYLGLAVIMGGGLVLFGVGAGNGFGGLLNAFTGTGSGSSKPVVSQAEKTALRADASCGPPTPRPGSRCSRRAGLGRQAGLRTPPPGTFTAAGKKELAAAAQAWQRYLKPDPKARPNHRDPGRARLRHPGQLRRPRLRHGSTRPRRSDHFNGYQCLAANAYAAKQTRKGDLAAAKAISLTPKAGRLTLNASSPAGQDQPTDRAELLSAQAPRRCPFSRSRWTAVGNIDRSAGR